jgi:Tol biopolymer transport system component
MDAEGGNEKPLTDSEAMDGVPVWSLDGAQIAYRSNDGGDETDYEVWIMGAESGQDPRPVGQDIRTVRAPAWAPGGDEIVYSSGVEGNHDLFIVEVGTGNWRPLASSPSDDRGPVWCCF